MTPEEEKNEQAAQESKEQGSQEQSSQEEALQKSMEDAAKSMAEGLTSLFGGLLGMIGSSAQMMGKAFEEALRDDAIGTWICEALSQKLIVTAEKVTLMQGDTVCWSGKCSLPEAEKDGMIYSEDGTSIGMFEYLEYHRASSETPAYIAAFLPGGAEERHSVRFVRSIGA